MEKAYEKEIKKFCKKRYRYTVREILGKTILRVYENDKLVFDEMSDDEKYLMYHFREWVKSVQSK